MSTSWKASVPIMELGTWPVMQMTGTESSLASAMAVRVLVAPGPEVAKNTAGSPVVRAMPWAMKPAPCSCRASTWRMAVLLESASYSGRLAPPGMPGMIWTPWRSSRRMVSSAPVMVSGCASGRVVVCACLALPGCRACMGPLLLVRVPLLRGRLWLDFPLWRAACAREKKNPRRLAPAGVWFFE